MIKKNNDNCVLWQRLGLHDVIKRRKIKLWLFEQIVISFCMPHLHFHRGKLLKPQWCEHLLESVPNKHVFFHLEREICRPGILCSTATLHYNTALSLLDSLPSSSRSSASAILKFNNISINCSALMTTHKILDEIRNSRHCSHKNIRMLVLYCALTDMALAADSDWSLGVSLICSSVNQPR